MLIKKPVTQLTKEELEDNIREIIDIFTTVDYCQPISWAEFESLNKFKCQCKEELKRRKI